MVVELSSKFCWGQVTNDIATCYPLFDAGLDDFTTVLYMIVNMTPAAIVSCPNNEMHSLRSKEVELVLFFQDAPPSRYEDKHCCARP